MRRNEDALYRCAWSALASVLLVFVSLVDYATGPDVGLSLFYILIVVLVAWKRGEKLLTLVAAMASSAVWLAAEWVTIGAPSHGVLILNAMTRLVILVVVGLVICRLRSSLHTETLLARTDFVTGALNSRAFHMETEKEIKRSQRYTRPLAVCYLDLDGFKSVNDSLGHSQGNEVLRAVAGVLQANVRSTDSVGRIGGDEFAVLLPEIDCEGARATVKKLRTALQDAMNASAWPVTASIGVAAYETPPSEVDALLKKADEMMYLAKSSGKNRVRVYSDQRVFALDRVAG